MVRVDAPRHEARGAGLLQLHAAPLRVYTLGASALGTDLLDAAEAIGHHTMRDLSAPSDLSLVNYTGGTTGRGKGVLRDQASMAEVFRSVLASFELPEQPCFLAAAPISHVAGTLLPPVLIRGGTVRLADGFAPDALLDLVHREPISATLLVPTMIYALLDHPQLARTDLSRLRTVLYGASPMAPSRLLEALERIGPVFAQLYGQTEGYPLAYLARGDHRPDEPELFSSCGSATAATTVALLDDANRPVAPGETGELCVRGPHVMRGYLGQPALTDETMRNGWLHTGDMARSDERGYLWLVDRKKDMIVSGGFNVYPREIEEVLARDPAVAQVAVIGTPDPRWGEAVTAIVECRPGVTTERSELAARLVDLVRQSKGGVLAPKRVEFLEALPRTPVGKIDKKALREPYWAGQARQIG